MTSALQQRKTWTDVAILGGGLAGLHAAHLLNKSGVDFQLVEARDRLGGRILTLGPSGRPESDGFDLGPSWFWPGMQPALAALVSEIGLECFEQYSSGDTLVERTSHMPPHRYAGYRQEPPSVRIAGGTATLIGKLAQPLPRDRLHVGARVDALRLVDGGTEITLQHTDGRKASFLASQAIVSVPPRLLAETVEFTPALPHAIIRQLRAIPTWMAPHAKLFAVYDRPFWRDAGLSGSAQSMVGPLAEIHDATNAAGDAALFGFVGIDARRRAAIGEAELTSACLAQLERLFGPNAATPRVTLYKDWSAEAFTATLADSEPTGHPNGGNPTIMGDWGARLRLAGSEVSANYPGYLAGAIEASAEAVAKVLDTPRRR